MATSTTPAKVAVRLGPIGPTIDKLNDLREAKRALEAKIKVIEEEYGVLEEQLLAKFEAEGTDKGSGKNATASVTRSIVGAVSDWDAFNAYVHKNKFYHLYQRRLSDPAIRELFEQGKKIPGCAPFEKKRLNLRSGV